MNEPRQKQQHHHHHHHQQQQQQFLLLLLTACFALICSASIGIGVGVAAAPSPEPAAGTFYGSNYGASFISNPSIYSYTTANNLVNKTQLQQQQQQQEQLSSSRNGNNNYMNFATNSNGNYRANTNRNYYYTNVNNPPANVEIDVDVDAADAANGAGAAPASASVINTILTPTQPAPQTGCILDRLAVYKVVLHTYWTRDLFPKHYPDWRPAAQWTKTLGRTHNGNYALYHIGQQATAGVKQFTETGKTDVLDSLLGEQQQMQQQQRNIKSFATTTTASSSSSSSSSSASASASTASISNNAAAAAAAAGNSAAPYSGGERNVFDEFTMPAIQMGAGRSEAKLFVDSNHSLVSLMTRIVPSPDWFIGVDSFELCVGGSWIDTVTVELDPLDAGTDNGFTFTAPNWPTSPQGVIYRITSRYPAHPAGSFYYPKSKRLPPIATFQFIKLKEYELSEVFNFAEDDRKYETVKTQTHLETEHNHVEMNNELSATIERERQTEFGAQSAQVETEHDRIRSQLLAKMNPIYNNSFNGNGYAATDGNVIPKNDKNAIMQSIANSYRSTERTSAGIFSSYSALSSASSSSSSSSSLLSATSTTKTGTARRRTSSSSSTSSKRRRDCRVSHWSEWTACSKTCGIGEMHRYRKVIKHGKRGGRPCPALQESKWCGSERGCQAPENYFNWSDT